MSISKAKQSKEVVDQAAAEVAAHTADAVAAEEVLEEVEEVRHVSGSVEPAGTEVAPRASSALATPAGGGGLAAMNAQLKSEGFEDLQLGHFSFETVRLQQEFETNGTGDILPNEGFEVRFMSDRKKWALTTNQEDEDERETLFVYDLAEIDRVGSEAHAKVSEWREAGLEYTTKPYRDVVCEMIDTLDEKTSHLNGEIVVLSIPKTSIEKLDGYKAKVMMKYKVSPGQVITKVLRGKKVTEAKRPFYPWAFQFVRIAPQDAAT